MDAEEREIKALLHLIDDPDQEVFDRVSEKILGYGTGIIPRLESLWEDTPDEDLQYRIEMLIHRLRYDMLKSDFIRWKQSADPDLLTGAILASRYQYPGLDENDVLQELKKIERNIWLELNEYLTPLEKINVLNSMIYSYSHIRGAGISYEHPELFFINKVIESKKGNSLSIGILYQVLCNRLNIPIYAVGLPRQFLLGYFDSFLPSITGPPESIALKTVILFYVDPIQGQIYSGDDVTLYLKKLMLPMQPGFFKPQSSQSIIKLFLDELGLCYQNGKNHYKYLELKELSDILSF